MLPLSVCKSLLHAGSVGPGRYHTPSNLSLRPLFLFFIAAATLGCMRTMVRFAKRVSPQPELCSKLTMRVNEMGLKRRPGFTARPCAAGLVVRSVEERTMDPIEDHCSPRIRGVGILPRATEVLHGR